ncbi:14979_t:CDS:2 [Funneliformis caledonium]|uniref:14979_t:CDS:1 n=1 Tax=Funneliformis caledonium TaxID=1117310 RepID=A0A9N9G6F1_9GLOM|nr:14979_t:CDS:2 [Funneliformis caledonium]
MSSRPIDLLLLLNFYKRLLGGQTHSEVGGKYDQNHFKSRQLLYGHPFYVNDETLLKGFPNTPIPVGYRQI